MRPPRRRTTLSRRLLELAMLLAAADPARPAPVRVLLAEADPATTHVPRPRDAL